MELTGFDLATTNALLLVEGSTCGGSRVRWLETTPRGLAVSPEAPFATYPRGALGGGFKRR